jgi:hypothetical protein
MGFSEINRSRNAKRRCRKLFASFGSDRLNPKSIVANRQGRFVIW